ncbi:hypothetical protein SDC9_73915 [bioreactor metagenome]|uniref:Uncharacterized protein n=1 Tax=bioreactor metagenome TaxID=1076179 RepID=A0A644YMS1_9ZZZZ
MFIQGKIYIFLSVIFLFSCKNESKNCITTPTLWGITLDYDDPNNNLGLKYFEYYIDKDKQVGISFYDAFETYDSSLIKIDDIDLDNYLLHKKEYFEQCDSAGYAQYLLRLLIDNHTVCKDSIEKVQIKILDTIVYSKTDSFYLNLLYNNFENRLDEYYKKLYDEAVPDKSLDTIDITDTMATIKRVE